MKKILLIVALIVLSTPSWGQRNECEMIEQAKAEAKAEVAFWRKRTKQKIDRESEIVDSILVAHRKGYLVGYFEISPERNRKYRTEIEKYNTLLRLREHIYSNHQIIEDITKKTTLREEDIEDVRKAIGRTNSYIEELDEMYKEGKAYWDALREQARKENTPERQAELRAELDKITNLTF